MKTKLTALALIAATALTLTPKPAAASDKGLAIAGGIIGGLIIGSAIADLGNDNCYPERSTTVIVDRRHGRDHGYWRDVSVEVWVPGCWIVERSRHGHSHRRYVGGHYEYRTNRVWMASNRYGHYDRHDRHDHYDRRAGHGRR